MIIAPIILRPDQQALIRATQQAFSAGARAPLLVAPCGFGKTVCFSWMTAEAVRRGKRVIIIAHREELLTQISDSLGRQGVKHGWVAATKPYDPSIRVHVASVQTLTRRTKRVQPPDLIITDEAHHGISTSYRRIYAAWPTAHRVGVTATPERLDGSGLGDVFDRLILGPSMAELISAGNLTPFRIFAPSTPDLSAVPRQAGDYSKTGLRLVMDRPTVTGDAVATYTRLAAGRRAVVFCTGVAHAYSVAEQFSAAGYPSACLEGSMTSEARAAVVDAYRAGDLQAVTNCDLLGEGFDLPSIEVCIMLRPTQSYGLFIQQAGRALRRCVGKSEAIILDHAGNTLRHGFPDDPREWSLTGKARGRSSREAEVSCRVCPACFGAQKPAGPRCIYCGAEFPAKPRSPEEIKGELEELKRQERRQERREQGQARTFEALVALARERNYPHPYGWAKGVLAGRR